MITLPQFAEFIRDNQDLRLHILALWFIGAIRITVAPIIACRCVSPNNKEAIAVPNQEG